MKYSYHVPAKQEEDSKSLMDKERRREAIKLKLQRLDETITKTKKDSEG